MAGNSRRSVDSSTPRTWTAQAAKARTLSRTLRVERLEDRVTPSIILDGIPVWQEAGPVTVTNGANVKNIVGPPDRPTNGSVQAIATHPTDSNIVFVGGQGGGLWRTMNATAVTPTWTSLTDLLPSLAVGDISIDPNNPNRLLVATGDTSPLRQATNQVGGDPIGAIFTDNALAPVPRFQTLTGAGANTISGGSLTSAIIRNNYLLVSGEKGVYRSLDDGVTWLRLSGTGVNTAVLPLGIQWNTVVDPGDDRSVYTVGPNGVFHSPDITAAIPQWQTLNQPALLLTANSVNAKLAVGAANVVFLAVVNPNGIFGNQLATMSSSTNQGNSWTQMDLPTQMTQAVPITGATNAGPIVITSVGHGLRNGTKVFISGVGGNTQANGVYTISVLSADTFALNGSTGNAAYAAGTGFWQEIYGIHPLGQGELNLTLIAHPTNSNLVYIGGTEQFATVPIGFGTFGGAVSSNGATGQTANLFVGNRTIRRQFTSPPFTPQQAEPVSPQWFPIVNNNTSGDSAPHNYARDFAFDSSGNLLEGDDGGIYKRNAVTPPVANLKAGNWTSLNGNLDLASFVSVAQDRLNNVIVGGTPDIGFVQQNKSTGSSATGNVNWSGGVNPGGMTATDEVSVPGSVYRYAIGSSISIGRFVRLQYDSTNSLISGLVSVQLANPATPGVANSGLVAADKTATNEQWKFVLNAVDPSLMLAGFNKLYEDANPAGLAGDTVTNVTPPINFQGTVNALAYGGTRLGIQSPEVAYLGTTAGQLWIRGAGAGVFTNRSIVGGVGEIRDIVVDKDDWQTAYVLQGSRIWMTTNGGFTFLEITGNLLGTTLDNSGNVADGLSTDIRTLALYDPFPGTAAGEEILIAGGRGGVFRRVPGLVSAANAAKPWLEYGTELPNALVYDLNLVGNRLVAGTFGRGAWVVPDISTTINVRAVVTVQGDASNNTITMYPYESNPAYVIVLDGLGFSARIERTVVQEFHLNGGGGADTINITANGFRNGDLQFVRFPVFVDAGGDVGDALNISNLVRTTAANVTITADQVGNGAGDNLFTASAETLVQYTGLRNGTLTVDLGADAASNNRFNVLSSSAGRTVLIGGPAYDEFHLNSFAATTELGSLDDIRGDIEVNGRNAGGLDLLRISDLTTTQGNSNVRFEPGRIVGFAGPTDSTSVYYSNIQTINAIGSNSDALAEQYTVTNPSATLNLNTDAGPDTVNVRATTLPVNVQTGAGNDTIRISSNAGLNDDGDLNQILGALTVDGGSGDNRLIASNYGNPNGLTYEIRSDQIVGGTPIPISYAANGGRFNNGAAGDGFTFRASNVGSDVLNVVSTLGAGSQTAIDGNGGNDSFQIQGDMLGIGGSDWFRGGSGNDAFTFEPGAAGNLASQARISGGSGRDTFLINGFDGDVSGDDNANVSIRDQVNGGVTGLGNGLDFDNLETVTFDGRGGTNRLTFTDATNVAYGSIAHPETGIVFRPTGSKSGEIFIDNGTVGPQLNFANVNGPADSGFVINGDPSGTGQYRDVLTVVGVSDFGRAAPGVLSGLSARSGADKITVTDQSVTVRNAVLGLLRPVALGRTGQDISFTTLVVRGGNEVGTGDTVTVTPSRFLNIYLDGGDPSTIRNGDTLIINGSGTRTLSRTIDPISGQPLTTVTLDDDSSVSFIRFEKVSGLRSFFALGADAGGGPRVRAIDPTTQEVLFDQFVYDQSFRGGVRVATGDVNGDGIPDLVVAAGPGGGPHVQIFDGLTFQNIGSFFAYEPSFTGGVYVAVGDVTGDGVAEIITGTGNGGGPLVRIFDYHGNLLNSFFAYESTFRGGVRVAVGDVDGDGVDEIITGAGIGGGPLVRVFIAATGQVLLEYFSGDPNNRSGLYVAAGDMDGDGAAEIVVGPGGNDASKISIRKSLDGQTISISVFDIGQIDSPKPLPSVSTNVLSATGTTSKEDTGLRVAMTDLPGGEGKQQVLVTRGPGYPSRVRGYRIDPVGEVGNFLAFDAGFEGGVFVG